MQKSSICLLIMPGISRTIVVRHMLIWIIKKNKYFYKKLHITYEFVELRVSTNQPKPFLMEVLACARRSVLLAAYRDHFCHAVVTPLYEEIGPEFIQISVIYLGDFLS